jgi:hypothetical protein
MLWTRLTNALAVTAVGVAVVIPVASASGGAVGEPRFHGSLPGSRAAAPGSLVLDPARLALVRVGARTGERNVVARGLRVPAPVAAANDGLRVASASNGTSNWVWAAAGSLALLAALAGGAFALSLRRDAPATPSTSVTT